MRTLLAAVLSTLVLAQEEPRTPACRNPVDVAQDDQSLIRHMHIHAGSFLFVPITGCHLTGCTDVNLAVRLIGEGGSIAVHGMTPPMFEVAQNGGQLVGLEGWSEGGVRCFSKENGTTPNNHHAFFIVIECLEAPTLPLLPGEMPRDPSEPGVCQVGVGLNYTMSCTVKREEAGICERRPAAIEGLAGCQPPSWLQLSPRTVMLKPDETHQLSLAGCGDSMGCSDVNISVLTLGGSGVDVFTIPTNLTFAERGGASNLTHLHLYGIPGEDTTTATTLPSRLRENEEEEAEEQQQVSVEVGADGGVAGDEARDASESAGADAASSTCANSPIGDDAGVCDKISDEVAADRAAQAAAEDAQAREEAAGIEAAEAERAAALTFRERRPRDTDPPLASLSRPVRCFNPSQVALPPSTGDSVTTVVRCSQPKNGKCIVTVAYAARPPPGTGNSTFEGQRWLAHLKEQEMLTPPSAHARADGFARTRSMSVEEAAAAAKAVADEEEREARQAAALEAARSPECLRFMELSGKPEAEGERRAVVSLPAGGLQVVEMMPECKGRADCGDWEMAAALLGDDGGVASGGKLEVWATTMSGFVNFTSTGVHPHRMLDVRPFSQCASATTEKTQWPQMTSLTDGGMFWTFTCFNTPQGAPGCSVSYVLKRL